jgi:glycosyltransferase involved in cell wall biosynthesis
VFVTVNTGLTRELEDIGVPSGRIHLIPNGVDSDRFVPSTPAERQAARATLGLPLETVLVLYVGRLAPEKGVDTLLDAWAMVEATPDTNGLALVLVGDGPAAEQYRERARAELQHTWFLGRLDDVRPALQAADLLVLPSLSEGMSNAVLEAMAAGLPTVATRIDGLTAQIEDGVTGLLVPPGDVDVLRGALLRLSLDPAYRSALGERARRVVERKYRPEIVLEAYEDLYRQLVSNDREEPACL